MDATKGFIFSDVAGEPGNTCSAANLHAMVDSATFSNMVLSDFVETERPVFKSGSSPSSPVTGQLWFKIASNGDTSNPAGLLMAYNGTQWLPIAGGAILTNKDSSVSYGYGGVCVLSTSATKSFRTATGSGQTTVIGITAEAIQVNQSGLVITHGFVIAASLASSPTPTNFGWIRTNSGSAGIAIEAGSTTVSTGAFGRLLDTTNKLCFLTGLVKAS